MFRYNEYGRLNNIFPVSADEGSVKAAGVEQQRGVLISEFPLQQDQHLRNAFGKEAQRLRLHCFHLFKGRETDLQIKSNRRVLPLEEEAG